MKHDNRQSMEWRQLGRALGFNKRASIDQRENVSGASLRMQRTHMHVVSGRDG